MPIFVKWEWVEKTKTFLVIFTFQDDFSKTNLRFKNVTLNYAPSVSTKNVPTMTWAPTHVEISLLAQLLQYANIIDGFSQGVRVVLKRKLSMWVLENDSYNLYEDDLKELLMKLEEKSFLHGFNINKDGKKEMYFCAELCPDYIEYISKVIRPYM